MDPPEASEQVPLPPELPGKEYKRLSIPMDPGMDPRATAFALAELNKAFSPGLFLAANGKDVHVFLREIDFRRLTKFAKSLPNESSAFGQAVATEIDSVRSFGIRSGVRQYVGYAGERRVASRGAKERERGRHYYSRSFPEERAAFPDDLKDVILAGDSEHMLARIPDNSVDLIFTSPPYNFGLDYVDGEHDSTQWHAYFTKLEAIWDECIRVLAPGGRIAINVQPLYSDYVPSHHIISQHFMKRGLIWKGEVLWEKNNYNCKYTAWGSWKSPSSPYLKYSWEFIEVFCKGALKKPGNPRDADIDAEDFKKWVYAKWSIAPERNMKQLDHPAMFPVELARRIIQLFSFRGDVVLDPFMGVGTTGVAARQLERSFCGIELSQKYCRQARCRIDDSGGTSL